MEDSIKKLAAQLIDFVKSLSTRRKVTIVVGTVGLVFLVSIIVMIINNINYSLLYQGLDPSEAGQIANNLTQMGIPYKVQGTGTILVDSSQVDSVKMKLAEQGYPKSTLTYDTFMKGTSWAMTDSDKQMLALYQTQDRLQDTIKTIPGVKSVEINIALQNQNSYVLSSDKVPTTASVKLNLDIGAELTPQQVSGIVQLVSHSVPDLSASNVTVLNSDGSPLTQENYDTSTNGTTTKIELENKIASQVKTKVLSILESLYGSGNVKVAAGVTLDFSQTLTTKTTTYSTNSATSSAGTSSVTSSNTGGVAGVTTGSQYTGNTSSAATTSSTTSNPQTNNMVDTINQQIQDNGGKVAKLTIAVVIDNKAAITTDVSALKNTVAFATGIDPAGVYVQLVRFAAVPTTPVTSPNTLLSNQNLLLLGGAAILAVFLIVLLIFILARVKGKVKVKKQEVAIEKQSTVTPSPLQFNTENMDERDIEEILNDPSATNTRKQIESFAEKKPELVAQLLRNWLND
jgi:flagellar M-ring protein FliF